MPPEFDCAPLLQPETIVMFDLLWKYYEKTRSYACAAKILSKLADRHSTEVDLKQRLEYLSRAIMCVKSGELGGESSKVGVGELLHDLEEKMEVARVQLQIVEALSGESCVVRFPKVPLMLVLLLFIY